ncbi:MAG: arabinogalactan endo-1,4-beta-galactosidase [Prevotella sp.]|jgi:arabinogalactan endo-1,4-beta-galactosidase|nr:arabinogalactan endo-1,4-beta-galactosidase [Prevotella sp.]
MKRICISFIICCLWTIPSIAQTFYICQGSDTSTAGELSFVTRGLEVSAIDSITMTLPAGQRFVGGDISLLTKYEEKGANYLDVNGQKIPSVLDFLKQQGMNAMRVRLFVDPAKAPDEAIRQGVVQDLDYVTDLGRRIKAAGLLFMLDFHYSDTWADPAAQWTPSAWATLSDTQLQQKIYEYTCDVLRHLNAAGASPDLIQTGNEISFGMLWGTKASVGSNDTNRCYINSAQTNWQRFFALLRQATKACREVCPRAQIIIHSERVTQPNVLGDYLTRMANAGIDFDIVGLSFYPYHHGSLGTLETALQRIATSCPAKKVMIVEAGYYHKWQPSNVNYDYSATYPITHEGQRRYAADLVTTLRKYPQVNGLFWWFMEANEKGVDWQHPVTPSGWYNAGLFDNETGCALPALYELQNFK